MKPCKKSLHLFVQVFVIDTQKQWNSTDLHADISEPGQIKTGLSTWIEISRGKWENTSFVWPTKGKYYNRGGFVFGIHASMPPMFTRRQNRSEFAGSLSSPSPCRRTVFAPGTLLWTGAPLGLCHSIFFLPLFAQRLSTIIGTNTLHHSYLCTHAQVQKKSAWKCAQQANT